MTTTTQTTRIAELEAALRDARAYASSWRYHSAEAGALIKRIDATLGERT